MAATNSVEKHAEPPAARGITLQCCHEGAVAGAASLRPQNVALEPASPELACMHGEAARSQRRRQAAHDGDTGEHATCA